jgi:hypothetical protein
MNLYQKLHLWRVFYIIETNLLLVLILFRRLDVLSIIFGGLLEAVRFLLLIILLCCSTVTFCEGLDLVVWGELDTLGSTVGTQWTTAQRAFYVLSNLPPHIRGILIGLLLSDAWLSFSNRAAKNAILGFEQSTKYPGLFMLVFSKLSHFCGEAGSLCTQKSSEN